MMSCENTKLICENTKLICENTKLICENTKLVCENTKLVCENTELICEYTKYFLKVVTAFSFKGQTLTPKHFRLQQLRRKVENWGAIFIYSCSQTLKTIDFNRS